MKGEVSYLYTLWIPLYFTLEKSDLENIKKL